MVKEPRQVALGTTYYNNPECLEKFVSRNIDCCDLLIVVDDGSPIPASDVISADPKIRLYRCLKDYGFNSHGCRNLIMKETPIDWCVLMDVDREFIDPHYAFEQMKTRPLKQNGMYRFTAYMAYGKTPPVQSAHVSVNDFLINKHHFWSAGGYDEEIIGLRTGDRHYFEQLDHYGFRTTMMDIEVTLTRGPSKRGTPGASPFDKGWNESTMARMDVVHKRMKHPNPNKPTLTFQWERVF